jgi:phytoene dehydrogenase-like protein
MEYDWGGTPIKFYRDVDKTEKHLLALSPDDEREIKILCNNIRKVKGLSMPVMDLRGVKVTKKQRMPISLLFSAMSAGSMMSKFSKVSRDDYISRFSHEGIREMLRSSTNDKSGVVPIFFTMGIIASGDGGFPEGGSLPFAGRIAETFKSMGGELLLRTRADRVVVENGRAAGVMAGGELLPADAVIIASDTMAIESLFDEPVRAPWLDKMRQVTVPTMAVLISLGIDADLKNYPKSLVFKLDKPFKIAERSYEYLSINNYANDPVYSPEGKAAVTTILDGDSYDFWKEAKAEGRYAEEKEKLAKEVIEAIAARIPESSGKAEVVDVATPLTYERYCGNWKGSWMTEMTPSMKMSSYPSVIDGLGGVYFAGQRIMPPGGLPVAVATGRTAVQYLCRDTGTVFISEE